jgi:hypothetical protein
MPRFTVREFGTSLSANGTSTGVALAAVASTGACTVLVWVNKFDSLANYCLFGLTGTTVKADFQFGASLASLSIRLISGGSIQSANIGYTSQMDGKWHLVAITRDGSNSVQASIDGGTLAVAGTQSGTFSFDQVAKNNGGETFKGLLDEFLWVDGTALTEAQILNYYYTGALPAGVSASLLYKFDEGSGTSATDSSGNGHTGTISNGTYSSNVFMKARTLVS